jgi:hypothetical protein
MEKKYFREKITNYNPKQWPGFESHHGFRGCFSSSFFFYREDKAA